ncbi:MAG: SRPBCC family protein [Deltaproteobacteria bacterium]|nr:SRPBCC family protein [Deltaproteobacteria bacterium]
MSTGKLQITTPSDREIAMTRVFEAPRHLVFEAYTKPELVKRWLGIHAGWKLAVCVIDLRVGGSARYLWRNADGREMGMSQTFREIVAPERLVVSEQFDQAWYSGEGVGTVTFVERDGRTTLTLTMTYESKATRDMILQSPMEQGVSAGFDMLESLLAA